MDIATIIVELMGLTIFVVAFAPQASRMWRKKHSFGMAPSSWTMNYIGRYLWVIASIFFTNGDFHMATIMLAGQGLVAMLTIPMVYYSFRNAARKGEYFKHDFALKLFIMRMIMIGVTFVTIIVCVMLTENAIITKENFDNFITSVGIGKFFIQIIPAIFTGVAFLPQTLQTLRTKDTKSISLITTLMFSLGNSLIILSIIMQVISKGIAGDSDWWYSIGSAIFASLSVMLMLTVSVVKVRNLRSGKEKLDTKIV